MGPMRGTPVAADTSRATPNTLRKSGRFGSTSMSRTASSNPNAALKSCPISTGSSLSTRMPSCTSAMLSSRGEHSIPLLITPRSLRGASGSEHARGQGKGGKGGTFAKTVSGPAQPAFDEIHM